MNDPLDNLLAPPPAPDDGANLRQELLARSTGVLRLRRRLKRLAGVAALAACYLGGMFTMRWFTPAPTIQVVYVDRAPEPKQETPPEPKKEIPATPETAVAVEYRALDATDRRDRAELYRKAAQLYRKDGDLANYVRCTGNALDEGTTEDLVITPDDDSLTIVLKKERQKEKRDARNLD